MATLTNLIFEAGGPRLKVSGITLFDRLEANPIRSCLLLAQLGGGNHYHQLITQAVDHQLITQAVLV